MVFIVLGTLQARHWFPLSHRLLNRMEKDAWGGGGWRERIRLIYESGGLRAERTDVFPHFWLLPSIHDVAYEREETKSDYSGKQTTGRYGYLVL